MDNYNAINKLVEINIEYGFNEHTDKFVALVFGGLLQYGLLAVGICIFLLLSFTLIRDKIKTE